LAEQLGLMRGASLLMPNRTPAKSRIIEASDAFHEKLKQQIESIGRTIGAGPGRRKK
jgi:hypothetical protein